MMAAPRAQPRLRSAGVRARPLAEARAQLAANAGTQLDPPIVAVFVQALERKPATTAN